MNLRQFIQFHRLEILLVSIWIVGISTIVFFFDKTEFHIWTNKWHNPWLDFSFKYLTYLGEGYFTLAIVLIYLIWNKKAALGIALAFSLSGLTTQFLKHFVFEDRLRPSAFFNPDTALNFVAGVDLHQYNSFPSGHTTAAFATLLSLSFYVNNQLLKFLLLFMASAASFSRVYLNQHFAEDILAGSLIGIITAIITFLLLKNFLNKN